MISILDYGCGNLNAFRNVLYKLNIPAEVVASKESVRRASKIILPGVGAFDFVMQAFNKSGLRELVEEKVFNENVPVLGICAGMQILGNKSDEGHETGLGWIPGSIRLFDSEKIHFRTKIPHMGWNTVETISNQLFTGIPGSSRFYFVHSYYFEEELNSDSIGKTKYGVSFTSAVNRANIYGVQFHPEKSHGAGVQLLKNFSLL